MIGIRRIERSARMESPTQGNGVALARLLFRQSGFGHDHRQTNRSAAASVSAVAFVGPGTRLVTHVGFAYGLSWAYWLPIVLAAHGRASTPWSRHVPGLIGPMLAALVVTSIIDGRAGFDRLIRSCVRLPLARWLLVALSPSALLAVALVVTVPLTGWPRWSDFGRFDGLPSTVGPIGVLLLLVVVNGIGEEAGWRGFLQPTLQEAYPVKKATLMVTAIWALWHTPLFLLDVGLGQMPLAMIPVLVIGLADAAEQAVGALVTAGAIAAALILVRRDPVLGLVRRFPTVVDSAAE